MELLSPVEFIHRGVFLFGGTILTENVQPGEGDALQPLTDLISYKVE